MKKYAILIPFYIRFGANVLYTIFLHIICLGAFSQGHQSVLTYYCEQCEAWHTYKRLEFVLPGWCRNAEFKDDTDE